MTPSDDVLDALADRYARFAGCAGDHYRPGRHHSGRVAQERAGIDNHLSRLEVREALAEGVGSNIRFSRTVGL